MEVLSSLLTQSGMTVPQALMLALLLLFVPTLLFFRARVGAGKAPDLRPIPAFDRLRALVGLAAETGNPLSITLGTGGVNQAATTETMAALDILDYLGEQAATYGATPLVTTGDPTALLAAQGVLQGSYEKQGQLEEYDHLSSRLVAPDAAAYAAGMMDIFNHQPLAASILAGRFGDEYLLVGETGVHAGVEQIAGAAQPTVLPFVYATSDRPILGEELFAAGAYLKRLPAHLGSLLAQDWMRILLILTIVAGIALKTLSG